MIKKGDRLTFRPEWQDPGDESVIFIALEDEDGGRVRVIADLGLAINPEQIVETKMIAATHKRPDSIPPEQPC